MIYPLQCKDCEYFCTTNCPWQSTKSDNIAGECFSSKQKTYTAPQIWYSTKSVYTVVSIKKPIEVKGGEK